MKYSKAIEVLVENINSEEHLISVDQRSTGVVFTFDDDDNTTTGLLTPEEALVMLDGICRILSAARTQFVL